ncbi:uncharacterized protein FOMMEDRAFT_160775 [Fomitiporia mediterranea MF3/22]|uniref:uncharacterized protein n=1 Tax=Fomitiporia mediterranea (strain MF3/22) TaxID=694068 RepID=UPI0004407B0C|nr:uncharacterized protein FOMMEDRAFT_160775 [Fomitiporia mediterranea MF3/22]EJC99200.1 hypothetical protein FOMMEDRAFT_160775 [Fomitiporia mediterranea MF3/22]
MSTTGTAKEAQKPTASNGNPTDWTEETKAMLTSKTKQPTLTDEDKTVLMRLDHLLHDRGCTINNRRTGQAYSLTDFEYQSSGPYIKISSNCGHGGMFAGQRTGILL